MLYDDVEFSGGAALKAAVLEMEAYPYHMHKDVLEIVFTLEGAVELTVVNNVLRMNDSAEMRHFMNGLSTAVAQRLEEDGDRERAGQIRALFREEMKKEYSAFAACFSL